MLVIESSKAPDDVVLNATSHVNSCVSWLIIIYFEGQSTASTCTCFSCCLGVKTSGSFLETS